LNLLFLVRFFQSASPNLHLNGATQYCKGGARKESEGTAQYTSRSAQTQDNQPFRLPDTGFASTIPNLVNETTIDDSLAKELRERNHGLPIATSAAGMQELDAKGTELWNLATRLTRTPNADHYQRTLCLLRVFAFFLLDSGHSDRVRSLNNCIRLLKVSFKCAKVCLAQREHEFCVKALERAAHYIDVIGGQDVDGTVEEKQVCERLKAEYFVLRTTLARLAPFHYSCRC